MLAALGQGATRRERIVNAMTELHEEGTRLVRHLWDGLRAIEGVTVYGPDPSQPRTPTVSFTLRDVPAEELTKYLVKRGIFTSHGDFYAQTVVEKLGKSEQGLLRVGCSCYTTIEEIDRLLAGVREYR
jgi:selenocysteine lyase/cysteine desulfurase